MTSKEVVKDVQQQLMEAGEKLLQPPSSVDELLSILNLADNALGKVEQSPGKSMQDALTSLRKALVSDDLLGHPDTDVKVFVAACISEVTRITAPDAPYDDEKMKRVFQLIVSSFEGLSDKSSRSYNKRISILETVAKVRSCVIMLDLECDDLILEMFRIFFRTIRGYHPDRIFTSMEIIMNLVLEESEEVSTDLFTILLSSVKRNNEEVPPIARRLGERIFRTSAAKLKPYLTQATKNSNISLNNYSKVLTSVCEGTVGSDASIASLQQQNGGCQAAVTTNDATQEGDSCKVAAASAEETQEDDGNNTAVASSKETQVGDGAKVAATKVAVASSEEIQEFSLQDAKDVERDFLGDNLHPAKRSPKTTVSNGTNGTSKEKTSVNGESSLKGDNCETENKSTNDEAIPKPDSHASGVEKETVSESKKSKMVSENNQKEASLTNRSEGSSEPSHVDSGKEAKMSDNLDSHEKDTARSVEEDISPEPKNVENAKGTGDVEPCNGRKDSNAASPSPSAEKANDNLLKRDGHQQGKDCATHGEVSSPGRVSEKESERASDSSGKSSDKKAHQGVPLKDETSVEIATPKHEDSGTSDAGDKLVKEPTKKFDLRDSDDDGAPLKKIDLLKCARTKARLGKGASKSLGRIAEKESERASGSEEASGESPDKKAHQESPLKDETSVDVATPDHEDSGTSDSEDKLVKEPTKKFDLRDSDDDGAPLKEKKDLIKPPHTKARPGKGASKSQGRITEKESVRASDLEEYGESPDKKAHQVSPLKDETSVEVATPKHEDSGTSDSEDKLVKEPTKKFTLRDSDDDGAPLKKKADSIKRARTKARPGKGASKSPGRITEKESERASDSEEASGEPPLKDETNVEVATPKHEDSGTSDSEDKLVKGPTKKFDLRDSDDDGAPLRKKADSIKRARTKARPGKGASKSPGRITEKESERASDSEEASGESPLKDETSVEVATPKHEDSGTSDSEDKLVKEPTKKFDLRDSDDDGAPLKKKADSIKRARTKARPGKGASKSFIKDDVKEAGSSQNRTAKSAKAKVNEDEIFSKRKRSLGKDSSGSLKYGKNLIRSKVKVWWPMDHQFYEGVIVSYDPDKRKHQVLYDDGEEELLNLRKEKWQLVGDEVMDDDAEPASTDASSEMPKSKKVKKSATSFAKLDDVSPKRKSKGKSSTSGKQTKNVKAETKSKDVTSKFGSPKSSGKAKDLDDSTLESKSKQDTPKIAGKSKETTPKTAGKSKEDTTKTAAKGKAQGSGSKFSANGAGKGKSNLSKGKGSHVQEKPSESPEVPESTKRKLSDSLKDHGSEFKIPKKQKRSIRG